MRAQAEMSQEIVVIGNGIPVEPIAAETLPEVSATAPNGLAGDVVLHCGAIGQLSPAVDNGASKQRLDLRITEVIAQHELAKEDEAGI